MRRNPSCTITASSYANAGSYARQFGMVDASRWLWPSWCCRPSPLSVVRPAVPPIRNPRARLSPAAQARSPMRWKPNIE
jgi:hypothetical protein